MLSKILFSISGILLSMGFYFINNPSGSHSFNQSKIWTSFAVALIVGIFAFIQYFSDKNQKQEELETNIAKNKYYSLLNDLANNPNDTNLKISTLEAGRIYYQYLIPDMVTIDGHGTQVDSTNNSAAREARIQNDINMRIQHKAS
ncbi:hypothetical protein [Halobacteriovorax sp. DA5]|uniref:hypothetical protein n=1 Tax=Halobacteriovorax sp. DA5 TaxID=2067553 RepID=UPI000CD1FEEE|nr:hypothetical protein [Halobacteriovorax sp. DA5]POB13864.1 hypothetical protein C0Z22_07330 [Halobacteriovorax sp. DA5]